MPSPRPLLETAHLAALGVWAGATVMTAATAAVIFPEMKSLDPALPAFSEYPGDHGVVAAGWVMARVFLVFDWVQLVAAAIAGVSMLALAFGKNLHLRWTRTGLTAAAIAVLGWYLLAVAQPMSADLAGYYHHAQAGEVEQADQYRDAFDARHPTASRALGGIGILALATLLVGGLSATSRQKPDA